LLRRPASPPASFWHCFCGFSYLGLSYSRELGNFSRSPIVSVRGNPNQYLATAGLAYSF